MKDLEHKEVEITNHKAKSFEFFEFFPNFGNLILSRYLVEHFARAGFGPEKTKKYHI